MGNITTASTTDHLQTIKNTAEVMGINRHQKCSDYYYNLLECIRLHDDSRCTHVHESMFICYMLRATVNYTELLDDLRKQEKRE